MANSGPSPTLVIADHLPAHIAELEQDLEKAVNSVLEIQRKLIRAKTLLLVAPPEPQKEK